jgi:hypothetical protein
MKNQKLETIKRIGTGLSFILFPLVFIFAFIIHPDLFSLSMVHDVNARVEEFHGNSLLHFGHALMLLTAPLLIVVSLKLMDWTKERGAWLGFIGCVLAIFGAIILTIDKTALCLVPSAFDTLPEAQFAQLLPGIEAMFNYKGWLALIWLLPLLPIGFTVQFIGVYKAGVLPRWQSIMGALGSLLLANPDIDIIGLAASVILAIALIPLGIQLIKGESNDLRRQLVEQQRTKGGKSSEDSLGSFQI